MTQRSPRGTRRQEGSGCSTVMPSLSVFGRARSLTVPDPVTRPWLLKAGVHPKVVSERLGHASIGITLDIYSHVLPSMQEEAAERIDEGLRKALLAG